MRHIANSPRGFTLVEVLIISPIVILFIGAFIGLLVTLTGESLLVRERNVTLYDTQAALDEIENSASQATSFLQTTSGINIASPQGKDNTAAAWTNTNGAGNPDTLIIRAAATTKNPTDPTRSLIYLGTGACDSKNPLYTYLTIYFVDDDPDSAGTKALFRRTITPVYAACASPWQRGSCDASLVSANPTVCKTRDEKLLSGVAGLDVQYFVGSSSSAVSDAQATTATDISVSLSLNKQVAGNALTYSSSSRTSSENIQSSSSIEGGSTSAPPANAPITRSFDETGPYPYRTTYTWSRVGNATNYTAKYRINGGTEQSQTVAQTAAGVSPSFYVDGTARKQTIQLTSVTVNTSAGSFSYGPTPAIRTLQRWQECDPIGAWDNYDGTYNTLGFTKTSSGAVGLKGLIRSGPFGDVVCYLPPGFAPQDHLIFNATSADPNGYAGNGSARVDVFPDGRIVLYAGSNAAYNNGWVSLDGIIYMTASGNPSWTSGSFASPWYFATYGDTYSNLKYYRDTWGRAWVQGLATGNGSHGASQTVGWMSAAMTPVYGSFHIQTSADNRGGAVNINGSPAIASRPSYGNYMSMQFLYYATGGLYDLALYNGWYNYSNGWSLAKCYKGVDDIVIIQGLVAGGNAAAGGMAGVHGCGGSNGTPYMSTGRRALFGAWKNWEQQGRVDLPTDGYLYPMATDPGWTSLDGIHYIAD